MTNNHTVLVTGAMGQLGRQVVKILLSRDETVIGLDLHTDLTARICEELMPKAGEPGRFIPAFVNLLDADGLNELLSEHKPNSILHLAAMVAPPAYKNPEMSRKVNVEGTRNLVEAAKQVSPLPLFLEASSASVHGSRNPHTHSERVNASTPTNPVDCYGEDKVIAEHLVADSGLPHATLRLGGILSPAAAQEGGIDHLRLLRATPRDNRIHTVDARDAALAFANAAQLGNEVDGKIFFIGGDETHVQIMSDVTNSLYKALGIGALPDKAGLPGDPSNDQGWGLTDWFDTTETQQYLNFQEHTWDETIEWISSEIKLRKLIALFGWLIRPLMFLFFVLQQKFERRGQYADPWDFLQRFYGAGVLAGGVTVSRHDGHKPGHLKPVEDPADGAA